jgi:tetratricopeptide (TPR) repeat protein
MHLGLVLARLDRFADALALESEAAMLALGQGNKRLEAEVAATTAEVLLASGAADLALAQAERAHAAADAPAVRASALATAARAHLALGDVAKARDEARDAVAIVEERSGAEDVELVALVALAEALDATGDRTGAREAIERARRTLASKANAVADPSQREVFLSRVPVNARILHLAESWS